MTDLNIPLEAIQLAEAAVLVLDVVDEPDVCEVATDAITAAAPLVVAADRAAFAELLRRQKFANVRRHSASGQNTPASNEFVAGAEWALRAIAAWCDTRAAELRGE